MTNRQTAAKIVAVMLSNLRPDIDDLDVAYVAQKAGKKHTSLKVAGKVKELAKQFLQPWIDRMEKVATPKVKKDTDESVPAAEELGDK